MTSKGWTAEKARAKYHRLKAEGRCSRCAGLMLEEWRGVICPECKEAKKINEGNRSRKRRLAGSRRNMRKYYKQDPEKFLKRRAQYYLDKKLAGVCVSCPEYSLEDSIYCEPCREVHRRRCREAARRRRAGVIGLGPRRGLRNKAAPKKPAREKAEPIRVDPFTTLSPIADYESGDLSLRRAAVRYVELCNGISAFDVCEAFGIDDNGNIAHALSKALSSRRITAEETLNGRVYYPIRKRRAA